MRVSGRPAAGPSSSPFRQRHSGSSQNEGSPCSWGQGAGRNQGIVAVSVDLGRSVRKALLCADAVGWATRGHPLRLAEMAWGIPKAGLGPKYVAGIPSRGSHLTLIRFPRRAC